MPPLGSITARLRSHPVSASATPTRLHPAWLATLRTSQTATTAWLTSTSPWANGVRTATSCNPAATNGRAGRRIPVSEDTSAVAEGVRDHIPTQMGAPAAIHPATAMPAVARTRRTEDERK